MNLQQAIRQLAIDGLELYAVQGKVTEVDKQARTCTVMPDDGSAEIRNCLLQGAYGYNAGFVLIPKVGSKVIVSMLSDHQGYIALTSEIEQIQLSTTNESLHTLMLDLCQVIEQLTVSTPAGPSGTPLPPTIQAISQLKQRIKNFIIK